VCKPWKTLSWSAEESHGYSTQPSIPSKARIQNLRKPTEIPKKKKHQSVSRLPKNRKSNNPK